MKTVAEALLSPEMYADEQRILLELVAALQRNEPALKTVNLSELRFEPAAARVLQLFIGELLKAPPCPGGLRCCKSTVL